MITTIKRLLILLFFPCLTITCTFSQEGNERKKEMANSNKPVSELTQEQQSAFDALNSIQVQGKHLYSTFSGIHHDCSPPDTSFVISQAELLIAMKTLLERHYTHIKAEQRSKLANESVLAQEEYVVLQCNGYSNGTVDDEIKYIPNFGTWILPEILGRRDVIIEW